MGIKRLKNGQEKLRKQGVRLRLSEKTQANQRKKECASGWIASNVGNIRGVDAASTSPPSTTALRVANAACAARGLVLSSQPPLPRQLLCNCNHPGLRLQLPQVYTISIIISSCLSFVLAWVSRNFTDPSYIKIRVVLCIGKWEYIYIDKSWFFFPLLTNLASLRMFIFYN